MSYEFYKLLHVTGILMIFSGLAGLWGAAAMQVALRKSMRLPLALVHGLGMALALISGFGMLARLGFFGNIPSWAYAKIAVWVALGGAIYFAKRKAKLGFPLLAAFIVLGFIAAYLAIFKPF